MTRESEAVTLGGLYRGELDVPSHGEGRVKIRFDNLRKEGAGWPPVNSEVVWAIPLPHGFEIDNIPFYAYGVAYQDKVAARPAGDDMLTFDGVLARSGHSTYRVKCAESPEDIAACNRLLRALESEGCGHEGAHGGLYAIDVPPGVDVHRIFALLEEAEKEGGLTFEEGYYYRPGCETPAAPDGIGD
ncbi:MAG: DUF4265 domain-containing protein [Candidatus Eremiobacteraeota bacterium]|nr:DUF4265 domain-containing protein [Candidatus Eremiobacteraeota bacterium]